MTGLSSNAARPNPAGEADLAARSIHRRVNPLSMDGGTYAVSCPCGWYEVDLPSKRRAHRAMTAHLEDAGSMASDLDTPAGRGRIAARARERAVDVLIGRHAAELAELEEAERVKLGLPATVRQERTP